MQIGAGDADIGQHVAVEAGEHLRLAPMTAQAGEPFSQCVTSASSEAKPRTNVPPAMGKTGIFALMFSLHVVCGSAAKFALAARRNHPKAPPEFLWMRTVYCTAGID